MCKGKREDSSGYTVGVDDVVLAKTGAEAWAAAAKIQELFLAGRRDDAAAAVPDEFLDDGGLFGSEQRIRERYAAWESSGATTLIVRSNQPRALELMAELAGTQEA